MLFSPHDFDISIVAIAASAAADAVCTEPKKNSDLNPQFCEHEWLFNGSSTRYFTVAVSSGSGSGSGHDPASDIVVCCPLLADH